MNRFQVSDRVNYHAVIDGPVTSTGHVIRLIGRIPSASDPVAWITGKVGCVCLAALSHATEITPDANSSCEAR